MMGRRVIIRTVAALVILLTPLATEECKGGSGQAGDSNPDAGRDSGGGDRAKVQNSGISKAAVTVSYGKGKAETIEPGRLSDLERDATKVCLPKGHAGDIRIGKGKTRDLGKGACRDLGDAGNEVVNVVVK